MERPERPLPEPFETLRWEPVAPVTPTARPSRAAGVAGAVEGAVTATRAAAATGAAGGAAGSGQESPTGGGFVRLGAHLGRLARTCAYLGVPFSPDAARAALAAATAGATEPLRVRLQVERSGAVHAVTAPAPAPPEGVLEVGVALERVDERDPLRRHKTTARDLYDRASERAAELGLADVVFLNRLGEVAEGGISNVFVRRGERLLTPPLASGALPGVLRGELIATGACAEMHLVLADLEGGAFLIGSSLRGLREVRLATGVVSVRG